MYINVEVENIIGTYYFLRGEEPVLSNMDISTGHMVLVIPNYIVDQTFRQTNEERNLKKILIFLFQAYMEDHLNNKNRLDSEWAALCAYEAEPCAVTVARKVSCKAVRFVLPRKGCKDIDIKNINSRWILSFKFYQQFKKFLCFFILALLHVELHIVSS